MRPKFWCSAVLAATWLGVAVTGQRAHGHHSFAIYDFSQQIPFEGVVESLNFKNPHIAMTLTRTLEDGTRDTIEFIEGAPANMLIRDGLRPNMIAPGTRITAVGSPLREDPTKFFLRKIIVEDGTEYQ